MVIKNKKDVDELQATISRELGIDVAKYRDEEVADNMVDLLLFPKYISKWVAQPLLLAIVLYIVGFFVIDLVHVQYLIYAILGLFLFVVVGIFAGVLNLSRKLNDDLSSISTYSLSVMKNAFLDIDNVGGRINRDNRKDVMSMLFQGIIHIVTIPMLSKAIENKLSVGSGIVNGIVKKSLVVVSNRLDFDDDKIDEHVVLADGDPRFISGYVSTIDKASSGVSGLLGVVNKIISAPFRFGFYLFLSLLVLLIYLLW